MSKLMKYVTPLLIIVLIIRNSVNPLSFPTEESVQEMNNKTITIHHSVDNNYNEQLEAIFDLLERGEKEIELCDEYKDIVLVLGNTGSGKSTFTQWIAGDNSKLIAKEVKEGTGEYIIEDNNRISNSTIKSKTIFPELVIDTRTNTAYYDFPGFSDTRSATYDIATTYFIKKIVDFAESVKMVFIVSHPSVRRGVNRQDFMKLMRHVTDLIKDIDKFQTSIALVVTKVDNQYVKTGKNFVLVEDVKVIGSIVNFLQEVKHDLRESTRVTDKELKFCENAIKFIDVILQNYGKIYTKIGIFRRPDESGSLINSSLLQEGKLNIERIIEQLNFTEKGSDDFGYTISESSKNVINDLVEEINNVLWANVGNIAQKMQEYYEDLVEKINNKIESFTTSNAVVYADKSEAKTFSSKLHNGYNIVTSLVEELKNMTSPGELAVKVNSVFSSSDMNLPGDTIIKIVTQVKYLQFLQTVSDRELNTRPWDTLFNGTVTFLYESTLEIQNNINDTLEKVNYKVLNALNNTVKEFQNHYNKKFELLDIQKLPLEFHEGQDAINNLKEEISQVTSAQELLKEIDKSVKELKMYINKNRMLNVASQASYFDYLQILRNTDPLRPASLGWVTPFEELIQHFYESENWYKFLGSLYAKFSEYEIQRQRHAYNVADINDWGHSGKPQGIEVTKDNFQNFLNKTEEFNLHDYNSITDIAVTHVKLSELNHVLNLTLKHKINIWCPGKSLVIKGDYLGHIDVDEDLEQDEHAHNCFEKIFSSRIESINVFALNTIFIHQDTSCDGMSSVMVIAPKWEVIGSRNFTCNGRVGTTPPSKQNIWESLWNSLFNTTSKPKTVTSPGSRGEDGRPGGAAGPGATFLGIGETFVNGANLTITASGGRGGDGEDGEDGQDAESGHNAWVPSIDSTPCTPDLCDGGKTINGFNCTNMDYFYRKGSFFAFGAQVYSEPGIHSCEYKIFGTPGGNGGDGGDGGRGGKGGGPGRVILFELNGSSGISMYTEPGKDGKNGKGGSGGVGGYNAGDLIVSYDSREHPQEWKLKDRIFNGGRGSRGRNGTDGANAQGMKDPEILPSILQPAIILNDYKRYLRENLNNRFKKYSLLQFLERLDGNTEVNSVYDTFGLIDEFKDLEEQFHLLNKEDIISFYQSLLRRVSEYAKKPKATENSSEYKKVLCYIYTATLGRIYNMQSMSDSILVIDISEYLDSLMKNIDALKVLQKETSRYAIIKKFRDNYKNNVESRIHEAKLYIEKQVLPEIDAIGVQIDNKIDLLINETIALQAQAKQEEAELNKKKKELEKNLGLRGIFNCFKILSQIVSFLGPIGAVVGTVAGTVTTVTESLVLDDQNSSPKDFKLPDGVLSDLHRLNERKMAKEKNFKKLLQEMSNEIHQYPEELGDIAAKIADINVTLKNNGDEAGMKQIKLAEDELKQVLKKKENELNSKKDSQDNKIARAKLVIGKLNQAIQLTSLGLNIYHKYKYDRNKLNALTHAIEQAESKFQALKQYEERIYNTITPMIKNVEKYISDIASNLDTKSQVALDITKWRVQGTLKDMKLQMEEMTKGFEVGRSLGLCLENLGESMTILINVYDRIQSYQYHQNFASYIADISSTAANNINITNANLSNTINELDMLIMSNLVVAQYKAAVDAFKQWVFPFGSYYLRKAELPLHLSGNNTVSELVSKAVTEIEDMKTNIDLYKNSVKGFDKYIHSGVFNSQYVSAQPFFVWRNEEYKSVILELLCGKKVVMKADIYKSPTHKDAIKFSFVEFNFKTKNRTMQSTINNVLKGFDISATHLGSSYYQFADQIYLISSSSQNIQYSLEKNSVGEPIRTNKVYEKIKGGDLMLSPYALWEIVLINSTSEISYDDLASFNDEVDVELVGYGSYIGRDVDISHLVIEDNYEEIKTSKEVATTGVRAKRDHRSARLSDQDGGIEGYVASCAVSHRSLINIMWNFLKIGIGLV